MGALPEVAATPCIECPWRRDSARGWLGPYAPEKWVEIAHGEAAIACHITIDKSGPDVASWDQPGLRQCAGAAIYRENVHKLPINRDIAVADEPDHEKVFSSPAEFVNHHTRLPIS